MQSKGLISKGLKTETQTSYSTAGQVVLKGETIVAIQGES